MNFTTVFCLPSLVGYSPCSASFYTTLLALLCSALLFSISNLIFSLQFSFLFWHGSSISMWCSRSDLICHVFPPLAFNPLCSNLIIPLSSVCSDLIYPYLICSNLIALLILWSDWSDPAWISPLRSALSCVPVDLLISLNITHHYVTHHFILAYTIT